MLGLSYSVAEAAVLVRDDLLGFSAELERAVVPHAIVFGVIHLARIRPQALNHLS